MVLSSRAALALALATLGCGLAAGGADGIPPPPDHPVLRERFHFPGTVLRVHRPRQQKHAPAEVPLRRLWSNHGVAGPVVRTTQDLLVTAKGLIGNSSWKSAATRFMFDSFPSSLKDRFRGEEKLGQGSFAVTYLAQEKATGNMVAVKVLMKGVAGIWLRPSDAASPALKELIDESKEECIKAQQIHDNDRVDKEGSEHVVRCLEGGITEALNDPSKQNMPLFIVMDFVGKNAMDWWLEDVMDKGLTIERKSEVLRQTSRDMMKGLRFLTHKDAPLKWVHHDLKPGNMAVDTTNPDEPVLTLIDLGTTTSNATSPQNKAICTPIYQPPELAGPANSVGYSLPIHSFDASSAALSILGLAGTPILEGQKLPLPVFYAHLVTIGEYRSYQIDTLRNLASCISELNGYRRDDFDKWMDAYQECLHREGVDKYVGIEIQETLDEIRETSDTDARIIALSKLIGCTEKRLPADKEFTVQVVSEWASTGFDKVLLSMLELDPAKRPTPEQVLEDEWLQESFTPKVYKWNQDPQLLFCENQPLLEDRIMAYLYYHVTLPNTAIGLTGFFAFLFCGIGGCCRAIGQIPSSAFTAVVAAMFVLSSGISTSLWLSKNVVMPLVCVSFVLGPALCWTGCRSARSDADDATKTAWKKALFAAGAFNLLIFCAIRWVSGPTIDMLTFIADHYGSFNDAQETVNVGRKPQLVHVYQALSFIKLTFFPPWGGLLAVFFGLWRESVHARRARGISRPAPRGMEMASATAGSAAATTGAKEAAEDDEGLATAA